MVFLIIALLVAYFFGYSAYMKHISPNLPDTTWNWVKNPSRFQFVFVIFIFIFLTTDHK